MTANKDVRVIQVVETTLTRRGSGKSVDDPIRRVREYWSLDGDKLAESDELAPMHCNAVGHRVMPGERGCSYCDATLAQIVRAAGLDLKP